jgi:hypothetical protein
MGKLVRGVCFLGLILVLFVGCMPDEMTDGQLNQMIAAAQKDGIGGDSGDVSHSDIQGFETIQDAADVTEVADAISPIDLFDASEAESDTEVENDAVDEVDTQVDTETSEDVPDVDIQDIQIVEIAPDVLDAVDAVDVAEVDADAPVFDVVEVVDVQEVVDTADVAEIAEEVIDVADTTDAFEAEIEVVQDVDVAEIAPDVLDAVDAIDTLDTKDVVDIVQDVQDAVDITDIVDTLSDTMFEVQDGQALDIQADVSECSSKNCDDGNSCTADSCYVFAGAAKCQNLAQTGFCDDGNFCTVNDICKSGACTAGGAKDCGDGDLCTSDLCKSPSGQCYNPKNWVRYDHWPELPEEWTVTGSYEVTCDNTQKNAVFKDSCVLRVPKGMKAGSSFVATLDLEKVRAKYQLSGALTVSSAVWPMQNGVGKTNTVTVQTTVLGNKVLTWTNLDTSNPLVFIYPLTAQTLKLHYKVDVLEGEMDNTTLWGSTLIRDKFCTIQ